MLRLGKRKDIISEKDVFQEVEIVIQFQCQMCGECCTYLGDPLEMVTDHLWHNASLKRGIPILLPFEKESLLKLAAHKEKTAEYYPARLPFRLLD